MITHIKRIKLKNAHNVRDLGGYIGEGGKSTKWNMLIRSDGLSALDDDDWNILLKKGVRTIIDLRSLSETKMQAYSVPIEIKYIHCPLQREELDLTEPLQSAENAFSKSLTQGYQSIVSECTDLLAEALKNVAEGLNSGAVLFHCSAGKDRTGVLASIILFILGVDEEDIIADYQVSYTYNKKGINSLLANFPEFEKIEPFLFSKAEYMETLIKYFNKINITELLKPFGFTQEHIDYFKKAILE